MSSPPEVLERTVRVDPATRFVRSLPGDYFLLREAAYACGVSPATLRKYIEKGVEGCTPSKFTMFGKVKIYLYTREDIERIQKHQARQQKVFDHDGQAKRIGRPPKYTEDERKTRDQLHSRKWYWKNRVKLLTERGDVSGVSEAQAKIMEIDKELKK